MPQNQTNTDKIIILDRPGLQKALGMKGFFGNLISRILYRILELDTANRMQARYCDSFGPDFSANILKEIGVTYDIPEEQLAHIPAEGGFITVSNHPYGGLDGLILNAVFGPRRPDMRIMTTFILAHIPSLKGVFIPVDNISASSARNTAGLREALNHLAEGKPLGFFPSGEVSTWQKGENRTALGKGKIIEDRPWNENIIKIIRRSGMPVIPVYFDGTHSKTFHRLGRIHPLLRTVRLPHELFNKRGAHVKVRIGVPIQPAEFADMDLTALGKYLRNRCYALEAQCQPLPDTTPNWPEAIAEPLPAEQVRAKMEQLSDKILFESSDYRAYMITAADAPEVMREVYRLREETFRAIGEGSGLALDTDQYDAYYKHVLLWSIPNQELVGAYRLGFGPEIYAEHGGRDGFYTASLYRYGEEAEPILSKGVELGRSFIVLKYQREVLSLKMLMAGVCVATTRCPGAAYFFGPMSTSNSVPDFYKSLAVHYIMQDYKMEGADRFAEAPNPFHPDFLRVDPDGLMQGCRNDIDAFNRLLNTLSEGQFQPLPVLARKYINCGARMACYNVDPLFSNSLDGLIVLRLSLFTRNILQSFLRSIPEDLRNEVFRHFFGEEAAPESKEE